MQTTQRHTRDFVQSMKLFLSSKIRFESFVDPVKVPTILVQASLSPELFLFDPNLLPSIATVAFSKLPHTRGPKATP